MLPLPPPPPPRPLPRNISCNELASQPKVTGKCGLTKGYQENWILKCCQHISIALPKGEQPTTKVRDLDPQQTNNETAWSALCPSEMHIFTSHFSPSTVAKLSHKVLRVNFLHQGLIKRRLIALVAGVQGLLAKTAEGRSEPTNGTQWNGPWITWSPPLRRCGHLWPSRL